MSDKHGRFDGVLITEWLKDEGKKDRTMKLFKKFDYIDPSGKRWTAAKGRCVDGASIPPVFWSNNLGAPYVGDFRRATVLHDVACQDKTSTHKEVHRMFYDAMRCDGVSNIKASIMYLTVRLFGPTWGHQVRTPLSPRALEGEFERLERYIEELGNSININALEKEIDKALGE